MKFWAIQIVGQDKKGEIDFVGIDDDVYLTERKAKKVAREKYGAREMKFWHKGAGRYFSVHEVNASDLAVKLQKDKR